MSYAAYGPGVLFITRNDIPNQPTINVGFAHEFSLDESGTLTGNYGTQQVPIDLARGEVKITGKFKTARMSGLAINAAFHGEVLTAGSLAATTFPGEVATLPAATSLTTSAATGAGSVLTFTATAGLVVGQVVTGTNIPAGTAIQSLTATTVTLTQAVTGTGAASGAAIAFGPVYTAANGTTFNQDLGAVYNQSGLPLLTTGTGAPAAAGQYTVGTGGKYFFHPADAAAQIALMYAYAQAAVGQTKIVMNHTLGWTPTFQLYYVTVFQGKTLYVRVFKAACSKFNRAFKLKDFLAPEFDIELQSNAAGQLYQETYAEVS